MNDLKISELLERQYKLWELHKDNWSPLDPERGRLLLLYLVEELGEVIAIMKKCGLDNIMENEHIRARFTEEMADVLMYYLDVLNCFNVSSEEFSNAFIKKSDYNLKRDFNKEYEKLKNK